MLVDTEITFQTGATTEIVNVPILDDVIEEHREMIVATVSTTQPNVVIADSAAAIIILDNDGKFTISDTRQTK